MGNRLLVYGPAYLDLLVEISCPLVSPACVLDQSLPARRRLPAADGQIRLHGPTGDRVTIPLPAEYAHEAARYDLAEPVLARRLGPDTTETVVADYPVARLHVQPGGMGAGYALALGGTLRAPFGHHCGAPDAVGREMLASLAAHGIAVAPCLTPGCNSDTSLVLLTPYGDKLAVGVREAMVCWRATDEDRALAARADALIFCGPPNALLAEVLAWAPAAPVLCAPSMRNIVDRQVPLADFADRVHYLTLNALEWAHLEGREALRARVPVITITDGAQGSRVLLGPREIAVPAVPVAGGANVNRAGETYGSTFFRTLLNACPDFHRTGVAPDMAEHAAREASAQAARQLQIEGFAFPGKG